MEAIENMSMTEGSEIGNFINIKEKDLQMKTVREKEVNPTMDEA